MQRIKLNVMLSTMIRCAWCSQTPPPHSLNPKLSFSSSSCPKYPQWSGLQTWRETSLNEDRLWGSKGPEPPVQPVKSNDHKMASASSLAELGALVLSTPDPITKSNLSHLAYSTWRLKQLPIGVSEPPARPARPPKPQLVCFLFL